MYILLLYMYIIFYKFDLISHNKNFDKQSFGNVNIYFFVTRKEKNIGNKISSKDKFTVKTQSKCVISVLYLSQICH